MTAASAADLAVTVRDVLNDGPLAPHKTEGFAALAALLARCQEAERLLDAQSSIDRAYGWKQRAEAAEAERDEARQERDRQFADDKLEHARAEAVRCIDRFVASTWNARDDKDLMDALAALQSGGTTEGETDE